MWGELLADKSDPLLRSFEIADGSGRLLLTLPFGEVLERARKPRILPNEVKSAQALLRKTRSLAASLHEEIKNAHRMIENAHRSMEQTQDVLARLASRNE
jgi:translation initiation factor 2B subunit (eIF-2B alpha/beta/delta family)